MDTMRLYLLRLGTVRRIGAPVPGYLVRGVNGGDVLIDTGPVPDEEGLDAGDDLVDQLAALGVAPGDIRYVVCSHLDPDHAGGHDRFPHAEFLIQEEHLRCARAGEPPRLRRAAAHWDLPHLRYRTLTGDSEPFPGIELVASGGHVPGHQSVLVRLPRTGPVLLAGDAVPNAAARDPDDRPAFPFDTDAAEALASSRKLVARAERDGALLIHGHDREQWDTLRLAPDYYD